jgi:hypothetical protein
VTCFCLKFVTFKLGLVATARLCIYFLFSIKGWAYGNIKLLHLFGHGNSKLLHLLGLDATTSFYNYFLLWVKGLQHSNLDLWTSFLFFNLLFATFTCFCLFITCVCIDNLWVLHLKL